MSNISDEFKIVLSTIWLDLSNEEFIDEITFNKYISSLGKERRNFINFLQTENFIEIKEKTKIKSYSLNLKKIEMYLKESYSFVDEKHYLKLVYKNFLFDKFSEKNLFKKGLYEGTYKKYFLKMIEKKFITIKKVNNKNIYQLVKSEYLLIFPRSQKINILEDISNSKMPSTFDVTKRIAIPDSRFRLASFISICLSFLLFLLSIVSISFFFIDGLYWISILGVALGIPTSITAFFYSKKAHDGELKNPKKYAVLISILFLGIPSLFFRKSKYIKINAE